MLSRHDRDSAEMIVNAVDHAVVAPSGAVEPFQAEFEWLAYPMGVLGKGPVDKLNHCSRCILWQLDQANVGAQG